jgi:hypothetical protein
MTKAFVKPSAIESAEGGSAAIDDVVAEVPALQPHVVRETQRLYRLRAGRFLAVVAADTEEEARGFATSHDALGGNWGNSEFASAEAEDTGEAHVFGDVTIMALTPPPPLKRSKKG